VIKDGKRLARQALFAALKLRKNYGYELWEPICIYDLAEKHGVEVRFEGISSMEGMYSKSPGPIIIISSERPSGRQSFNCAHELGHHVFNHGGRIDELIDNKMKNNYCPEEFLANCFAGFLLMPKVAIQYAFRNRGWSLTNPTHTQLYIIADNLGVGYSALITHMQQSLRILNPSLALKLLKVQPKHIKAEILGYTTNSNLVVADESWKSRAIDIQVGDLVLTRSETINEGECISPVHNSDKGDIFEGVTPGIGRLLNERFKWATFVRVSRKQYVGLGKYRHLKEVKDDE
jgi:Zn-dependent peptidase ImmA (M78 family)